MNYYFYGGAFNPMTKAHLKIIIELLNSINDDDLLIIGVTNHDYKQYQYSFELRYKILKENLIKESGLKNIENKFIIIEQNKRSWKFFNKNANVSWRRPLILVLGEDEFSDLKSLKIWHDSEKILKNFQIKVFSRSDDTKDISSTRARLLLNNNGSFDELNKYITKTTYNILKNGY